MRVVHPVADSHVRRDGVLTHGLTFGALAVDPLRHGPRHGRARRWLYAAAGGRDAAAGCAVVDLGAVGTVFVWAVAGRRMRTWERRVALRRGLRIGPVPAAGASYAAGRDRVTIDGAGGFGFDVRTRTGERLRAAVAGSTGVPAVLVTATPAGGWNVTEKEAGYPVQGWLAVDGLRAELDGGGWRDWTAGRQDRQTSWRWAAGAGRTVAGGAVGFNVSTGMNAAGAGEDVVWWDGRPQPLPVTTLAPVDDDPAGRWRVAGPDWSLELEPWGVRAAEEDLRIVRSEYVQPVGRFRGSLPGPTGTPVAVEDVVGVTEEHRATW